ncbi:MAG: FmdE family protein [Thermodesulfobacteriota bacterium]
MDPSVLDQSSIRRVIDFHGHSCPGLAIGIRAAEIGLVEVGRSSQDEEVVAVVETDMCGVDAIQVLMGCTFGKGNLIHLDYGKNAFSFFRRSDGKGIRVVTRPDVFNRPEEEMVRLRGKMDREGLSGEEKARLKELTASKVKEIMEADLKALFDVKEVSGPIPGKARILDGLLCDACGERTMESRIRRFMGQNLCPPCFEEREARS